MEVWSWFDLGLTKIAATAPRACEGVYNRIMAKVGVLPRSY